MLPELLSQIPPDEEIASVTADGAYDTRKCHDAIAERRAHPVIPPARTPSHGRQKRQAPLDIVLEPLADNASTCNEALRATNHLGRSLSLYPK